MIAGISDSRSSVQFNNILTRAALIAETTLKFICDSKRSLSILSLNSKAIDNDSVFQYNLEGSSFNVSYNKYHLATSEGLSVKKR